VLALLLCIGFASATDPPFADFTAHVTSGIAPLPVSFTDLSLNTPTGWAWFFGDETYTEAWTKLPDAVWSARSGHSSVAMSDGSIVLMGGQNSSGKLNDVWRSTDNGTTWTQQTASAGWSARYSHTSVAMPDGSIVLMGGNDGGAMNDVWRSTDNGTTWTLQTVNAGWARWQHSSVAMPDGSIVLMGGVGAGLKNDVWNSTDNGATWTQVTASAGWTTRGGHTSVVMPDSSIVLMGGYDGSVWKNDVWRSTDKGATWTQVNASAGWTGRRFHSSVAMPDGSIVLTGGVDSGYIEKNDVWRSTDNGATWTQVNASPGWTARGFHSSVAMPDGSIVLMGGWDNSGSGLNDVWRLQPAGSSAQNLSHTYTAPGTYSVALQAYNAGGYNSTRKTGFIVVTPPPVASFTANITSGPAPLAVQFYDNSTGTPTPAIWNWSFGDGNFSDLQNPIHIYDFAGTFTVNLTVSNALGEDTISRPGYISVTVPSPPIMWEKMLGGSGDDEAYSVAPTEDGGFIIAGYSYSNDGDVTGNHGGSDYWVVKLDSNRHLLWQKSYGGSGDDYANSVAPTEDGGFIIAGYSYSNDGDVTGNHGDADYWLVKLDASGDLIWQKSYGGSGDDYANSVAPTEDGGFIIAGYSESNDGDVSGNHGSSDYWLVKLDAIGEPIWQKSYGGSGDDYANSVAQTTDGGYIVAGTSNSIDGDVSGNHGDADYWLVKLDASGDLIWQKSYGGSGDDYANAVAQTMDGGYIVAGYSWSSDGDVSGNHGGYDYWVVKLGADGNLVWQKSLGGSYDDYAESVAPTSDGGYIVAGTSNSIDGDVSGNHGSSDYWLVKLDASGDLIWQKVMGGSHDDRANSVVQMPDGGYVVAGFWNAGFGEGGEISDYWVVKIGGSPPGPSADFSSDVTSGTAPLTVQFTDTSTGSPTSWNWSFGDGNFSESQDPDHTYAFSGSFTLNLTVSSALGNDSITRAGYITCIPFLSLADVLDNPSQTFTTSGDATWFGQTDVYHYGGSAARSGDIEDNQQSVLETTVDGPVQVSFSWTVSSEEGYDYLRFYIDGEEKASISGEPGTWAQEEYSVGTGSHTLTWSYSKDGSESAGMDAGWVDRVVFGPTPAPSAMFRGDLHRTGVYEHHGTYPRNWEKWQVITGGPVVSSPAVINGIVYVGSDDGNVYALDAGTGSQQWEYTTGGMVRSSPAVINGTVYVGSDDGNVYALDAGTGLQQWEYTTGGMVRSSPAVINGTVYAGSDNGNVYALDAGTGSQQWMYPTGGMVRSSPAIDNGVLYIGSADANLYAIDMMSGSELWRSALDAEILSTPAIAHGRVYIASAGTNGTLYALNPATGTPDWISDHSYNWSFTSSPAVSGDYIFIGSGQAPQYSGGIAVFDASSGSLVQFIPSYDGGSIESSPAVSGGVLYAGSGSSGIGALDGDYSDGLQGYYAWSFPTYGAVRSSPVISDGNLYFGCDDGNVYALKGTRKISADWGTLSVNINPVRIGDPFTVHVETSQPNQIFYLVINPYWSTSVGSYDEIPAIVSGQTGVDDSPEALEEMAHVSGYSPSVSHGAIVTTDELGTRDITFSTDTPTKDATFWIDLLNEYSLQYVQGTDSLPLTTRIDLPPTTGPRETRITTNAGLYENYWISPAISGDRIVWQDYRNGYSDIYLYDISTGIESRVTTDSSSQYSPAISGDRIVWYDYRNGDSDIYLYDISTGIESRVTTDPSSQYSPSISGDRIVWQDYRNGDYDIYFYDISTGIESRITTNTSYQSSPSISGDRIVWMDDRNGDYDIYLYDISTGIESRITTNTSYQYSPAISGDRIVWQDSRNGDYDIYLYDISTGIESRITTNTSYQSSPSISGDRIVWMDDRNGNMDIYSYNLNTCTERAVCTDSATQEYPALSGNHTVWLDYRNGYPDLYLYTFEPESFVTPVTNFTANMTSGVKPLTVEFTDLSTNGPGSWNWSFGDGNFSTVQNPVHTYEFTGTFTVSLNATNAGGSNVSTRTNYIIVTVPKPIPDFSVDINSGAAPLPVSFTDASLNNPTGWAWFFGDEDFTEPWTEMNASAGWPGRGYHSSVVMPDGSIVLMGGTTSGVIYMNDVWRSTDNGATWTEVNASAGWSARIHHSSVVMPDGSIVLMGGDATIDSYKNDTWRSTDKGATWIRVNASAGWSARAGHSSVAMLDGSILLMGGTTSVSPYVKNDVWRSTDYGATWTEVNASAGWTARSDHSSVAMPDGSILLMGGGWNDTWRSTDNGTTWTLMNSSAGWSARSDHSSVAMPDGSIVLMGGSSDAMNGKNDTWRSMDNSATWTEVNASSGWSARFGHSSVTMPDGSIVLTGGFDGGDTNDVWGFMPAGSSAQNPSHTYTTPGIYQVALQAYNNGGYNSTRKTGYITVTGLAPVASFTTNVTSGTAPLPVQFNDTSTNTPTAWNWSFKNVTGNNTQVWWSTVRNATQTFGVGNFSIALNASNSAGYNISTQVTFINVTAANTPPVVSNVVLTSTSGFNRTSDNLTLTWDVSDPDGNPVRNITNWYRNGTSITVLNMPFEGGSNSTFTKDYSGYGNSGTDHGAVWNATGGHDGGGAYDISGTQYLSISDSPSLDINGTGLTLEAWVYPRTLTNYMAIVGKEASSNAEPYWVYQLEGGSSGITFRLSTNGNSRTWTDVSPLSTNRWYHVVGTYDGTAMRMYINGELNKSVAKSGNVTTSTGKFSIGRFQNANTDNFNGIVDGVRVYNRALSAEQIQALYLNSTDLIVSQELIAGDTWQGSITPNDGTQDGNATFSIQLNITSSVPVASFTGTPTSGTAPLTIQFNDTSPNTPTAWNWSFRNVTGNNTQVWWSTVRNATQTFGAGNFSIALNVSNSAGYNISTQVTFINVTAAAVAPVASFTANVTSGTSPLPVLFTDLSLNNPTGWAWYFGDENFTAPWTQVNASAGWSVRTGHSSVVLPDGSIVLMGGYNGGYLNDVWRSTNNGLTWIRVNASAGWTGRNDHYSVAMPDGSIVLMGGGGSGGRVNDVWRSTNNGVTWIRVNASAGWTGRQEHTSVVLPDGSIVLMGGVDSVVGWKNDTWRSTNNGATWTQVNASSGWSARYGITSVVMPDGSIVLTGGYDGIFKNDVWRSMDTGATWTKLPDAGWSVRTRPTSVVMPDGSIVLMGGYNNSYKNDVWRSTNNGVTWTQVNASAGWTGRESHSSVAMPDGSIVVMGGTVSGGGYRNDVWRFMPVGSSAQNPSHTYTAPGVYMVALQAYNAGGYNSTRKAGYITVTAVPVANFTANVTSGTVPLVVQFIDNSTGFPTGWNWTFGDIGGSNTSTLQNPVHTYLTHGNFTVSLNAANTGGNSTIQKTAYISVRIKGDINNNDHVDIVDVTSVAYMVVRLMPPDIAAADFNSNGRVDIGDAAKIAYYYVGKIGSL